MSHQCPFPVRATDTRRCYRTGSVPGFTLSLTLVAILSGYAGLADAAPAAAAQANKPGGFTATPYTSPSVVGYVKGRLLVAPRPGLSDKEFDKVLKSKNAKSKGRFTQANIHVIELPDGTDEVQAMNALKKDRRLKFVELDMVTSVSATVSDPKYSASWALPKIQAPTAWDSANGSGIVIAVLDTGVEAGHADLAANMVPGWNLYDNNSNTADVHGHGTAVAGTAAAVANNGNGSAGVAYAAKIMPVRVASSTGSSSFSMIAQGVYWAADNGAKVVNASFAGLSGSLTVQSAAQYLRSKGGVLVVSAGNSGGLENVAAHDSMLSVSATDQSDALTSFSSYGPYVDLAAPGKDIYAPYKGGGYIYAWGTSFSSPVVAGAAALVMSANDKLGPADVDKVLKSTTLDLGTAGFDQKFGFGRVDASRAVASARGYVATDSQAPTVSITSPTGGGVTGVVPVDVSYSDNVGVTSAELYVNGTRIAADNASPFGFSWDTSLYGDGTYTLMAKAYDAAGNVGTSTSVSVTLGNDSMAPVIGSFNLADGMVVSSSQAISASATDNQKVARMSLFIDGTQVATTTGSSISYSWNTRKVANGDHTVRVGAWDAAGNAVSKSVTVRKGTTTGDSSSTTVKTNNGKNK